MNAKNNNYGQNATAGIYAMRPCLVAETGMGETVVAYFFDVIDICAPKQKEIIHIYAS